MNALRRFAGTRTVITGAASGIGRATCQRFAEEGARVVVADVNQKGGKETVALLPKGKAVFIKADVSQEDQVKRLIKGAAKAFGKKSGGGIHAAKGDGAGPGMKVLEQLRKQRKTPARQASRSEVVQRLIYPLVDEAYRCLDEQIVAAEQDLDLGLVMGIGFPPFLGGVSVSTGRYDAGFVEDVVVSAGRGGSGAARTIVYDGTVGSAGNAVLAQFAAYGATERPNAAVFTVAVDTDGDGDRKSHV